HLKATVTHLLNHGWAKTNEAHQIRLVAFGNTTDDRMPGNWGHLVTMNHVVEFLETYVQKNWDVLKHVQTKDSVLGLFELIKKSHASHASPKTAHRRT
ncbi:MAG TPA: hypothetical protein VFV50_15140, partial [Bdellovibrionales bacterium]|nr:hypothetical protein [Bdellovibrionales bacterium]